MIDDYEPVTPYSARLGNVLIDIQESCEHLYRRLTNSRVRQVTDIALKQKTTMMTITYDPYATTMIRAELMDALARQRQQVMEIVATHLRKPWDIETEKLIASIAADMSYYLGHTSAPSATEEAEEDGPVQSPDPGPIEMPGPTPPDSEGARASSPVTHTGS
jgi:hypothetical protein